LRRDIGLTGAILMGLGSIVGAGVFVSIGIAAGIAGPSVLLAIAIAGLVATCNALSSAQLAAAKPVSGGTYEYGYAYLSPRLGFSAGWMFLFAKSASAATAALGFAGYVLHAIGVDAHVVPVALLAIIALTLIVLAGVRFSSRANAVIVSVTIASLALFVVVGLLSLRPGWQSNWKPFFADGAALPNLLEATALMFVAFTGYARIATLGEEVHDPRTTIPNAIITTLWLSAALYLLVGGVAIASVGTDRLARATQTDVAPLLLAASALRSGWLAPVVPLGAVTAMLSVLLNLILGISRMLFAMARRGDMPRRFAYIDDAGSPSSAVIAVGVLIAGLALFGNVRLTWSFSAFAVLVYYAITNLAALRLPEDKRMFSPLFAWGGLASCLFLAFWVEWQIWALGLGLLAAGQLWHTIASQLSTPQ
jgi:APA family basic amino acid/polyamine antiporter